MRRYRYQQQRLDEDENTDRWLISYADFITLLFAFFVVMYAVSSVNEGKYRILSDTLGAIFQPDQITELVKENANNLADRDKNASDTPKFDLAALLKRLEQGALHEQQEVGSNKPHPMTRVSDQLSLTLGDLIDEGKVDVSISEGQVRVQLKAQMLFGSGGALLKPKALSVLQETAQTLSGLPNIIQVEGHTDNDPIKSDAYASNWELSAARAASVARYLHRGGIAPQQLSAVGRGEFYPVADNNTEQGKSNNRRVTIVILDNQKSQQLMQSENVDTPWAEAPALEDR